MMREIIVLRGLPASGKSSWAIEQLQRFPGKYKRINNDNLRAMLDASVFSKANEELVTTLTFQIAAQALNSGYDVILDNTYLNKQALNKVHSFAKTFGDIVVSEKVFTTSLELCLARNSLREGISRVPEKVIFDMAKASGIDTKGYLDLPNKVTVYKANTLESTTKGSSPAIVCDLDGTLALIGDRSPYDAANCHKDSVNNPVLECLRAMYDKGYEIIFLSGRDSKHRQATENFLAANATIEYYTPHGSPHSLYEPLPYKLFMRPEGDTRKDSIVKRELFEQHIQDKYSVLFWIDDRPQVVRMARNELGMTVFALTDLEF